MAVPYHGMAVPNYGMAVPNHGTEIFVAKAKHLYSIRARFLQYEANISLGLKADNTSKATETISSPYGC